MRKDPSSDSRKFEITMQKEQQQRLLADRQLTGTPNLLVDVQVLSETNKGTQRYIQLRARVPVAP